MSKKTVIEPSPQPVAKKLPYDIKLETLRMWCHWKRKEQRVDSDTLEFVQDIEDFIAELESLRKQNQDRAKEVNDLAIRVHELKTLLDIYKNQEGKR